MSGERIFNKIRGLDEWGSSNEDGFVKQDSKLRNRRLRPPKPNEAINKVLEPTRPNIDRTYRDALSKEEMLQAGVTIDKNNSSIITCEYVNNGVRWYVLTVWLKGIPSTQALAEEDFKRSELYSVCINR